MQELEKRLPLKNKRPERREFTAFHEASHALVAHVLGWDVPAASIAEEESFRGYTVAMH